MSKNRIDTEEFGNEIRNLQQLIQEHMIRKGLRCAEVDALLGYSQGYTSHYLQRGNFPGVETLLMLRDAGFPIYQFFLPVNPEEFWKFEIEYLEERISAYKLERLKDYHNALENKYRDS